VMLGRSRANTGVRAYKYIDTRFIRHLRTSQNIKEGEPTPPRPTTVTAVPHRRGTVLLTKPLKSKKISTDARDKALAQKKLELQRSKEELESLRTAKQELEAESMRIKDERDELQRALDEQGDYKQSLLKKLFAECKKNDIYWVNKDPRFMVFDPHDKGHHGNKLRAMDMDLNEILDFAPDTVDDAKRFEDGTLEFDEGALERYMEKIIRSAQIFQNQYNIERQKRRVSRQRSNTIVQSSQGEVNKLKVKMENMTKEFEAKMSAIKRKHGERKLQLEQEKKDIAQKLQTEIRVKQVLITAKESAQSEKRKAEAEKERWENEYGGLRNQLDELLKHPMLSTKQAVERDLQFRRIQREFANVFDGEGGNTVSVHQLAFGELHKMMRKRTKFEKKYCQQMAFKVLFEIIHLCRSTVESIFYRMRREIGDLLGIGHDEQTEDDSGRNLEEALDFLMKYQFDAILKGLWRRRLVDEVVEAVYLRKFDLIQRHEQQDTLSFELYDAAKPRGRSNAMVDYVASITKVCWKMVVYQHGLDDAEKRAKSLCLWPQSFLKQADSKWDPEIYENQGHYSEKKQPSDRVLFTVFPVVIRQRYSGNIIKALIKADEEDDGTMMDEESETRPGDHDQFEESESKMDDDEKVQMKPIQIKVVKRAAFAKSFKKGPSVDPEGGGNEQMDRVDQVRLLVAPPSLAKIKEEFASIHAQHHKTLMDHILDKLEEEGDSDDEDDEKGDDDDDDDGIDDEDRDQMKAYKLLWDVLVSCYLEINGIIEEIRTQKPTTAQLRLHFKFHVMLNMVHYNGAQETDLNQREKRMVDEVVHGIWTKYANSTQLNSTQLSYPFLSADKGIQKTMRRYILECCSSCFHFGAHSLITADGMDYALYPLCFIRRDAHCSDAVRKLTLSSEGNDDGKVMEFERKLSEEAVKKLNLLRFDDNLHCKEPTSDEYDRTKEANICFFTWPAIVERKTLIETSATTQMWVQLNDDLHKQIYGE